MLGRSSLKDASENTPNQSNATFNKELKQLNRFIRNENDYRISISSYMFCSKHLAYFVEEIIFKEILQKEQNTLR